MDEFEEIVEGVELDVPDDLPDYSTLTNFQLMNALQKIRKDLMDRGVIIDPKTPEDMGKQSVYYGLLWEAQRRDWKK